MDPFLEAQVIHVKFTFDKKFIYWECKIITAYPTEKENFIHVYKKKNAKKLDN